MAGWGLTLRLEKLTVGPPRESRSAEMRAYTCCTVSSKGATLLLRICHSSVRCTDIIQHKRCQRPSACCVRPPNAKALYLNGGLRGGRCGKARKSVGQDWVAHEQGEALRMPTTHHATELKEKSVYPGQIERALLPVAPSSSSVATQMVNASSLPKGSAAEAITEPPADEIAPQRQKQKRQALPKGTPYFCLMVWPAGRP